MNNIRPEQEAKWRAEFEGMPEHQIRRMIEAGNWRPIEKEKLAQKVLDERNPAWAAVKEARGANTRATWAIIISILSFALAAATFIKTSGLHLVAVQ